VGSGRPHQYCLHCNKTRFSPDYFTLKLKGHLREIFDPRFFFHKSTPPKALIHRLKPFRIWLRICQGNRFNDPAGTGNEVYNSLTFLFIVKIWYGDISLCYSFVGYSLFKKVVVPKLLFEISAGSYKFQRGQ
jgi:hypothetical protein